MFMTAFTVLFVGGFVAAAALGHILLVSALVSGKADREMKLALRPARSAQPLHAAQ